MLSMFLLKPLSSSKHVKSVCSGKPICTSNPCSRLSTEMSLTTSSGKRAAGHLAVSLSSKRFVVQTLNDRRHPRTWACFA